MRYLFKALLLLFCAFLVICCLPGMAVGIIFSKVIDGILAVGTSIKEWQPYGIQHKQ